MKTALTFCIIVFSIFENANISISNNVELSPGELIIRNYSNYYMKYSVYPIGALFNSDYEYSPKCVSESPEYTYLIGGEKSDIPIGAYYTLDEDNVGGDGADDAIGRGNYRIDFYEKINTEYQLKNYCYVDFGDHDYPYQNVNFVADILIDYYSDSDIRVWGLFQLPEDRTIRIWDQRARNISAYKLPNKNGFISSSEYLQYPINAIQYGGINHLNPGDLGMNLVINHNITTRDTALGNGSITIAKNGCLKISSAKTFNMKKPKSGFHNLVVQDSSLLWLDAGAHLIVDTTNRLILKQKGIIKLGYNSEILFEAGSQFCNEGGAIIIHETSEGAGFGKITMSKGYHQFNCAELQDFVFGDSIKLILADSSVMEIPDSTTLHFIGPQSGLIMNPNSKLKMGEGSKILFDSGASIFANGGAFTSIDSTLKWDGIILNNSDADTITNCTFSNAVTALTFTNNSNSAYKNRIITNNTFNIPDWGVNKGIYGENNYKILIKNNVFNMPVYYPSSSPVPLIYVGVYLKNSSTIEAAGGDIEEDQSSNYSLNIIENTFSNGCASVILANYTSNYLPYIISDNILNNTASVNIIGMKISGTIRDNNFTSDDVPLGIHLINSSPNLYKNTINSRDVGLHLAGHCYPNLAPYVSGENLVWTGGNNYFTTTDIDNIQLSSSGYVSTDFGNNSFTIDNSSSYHIYGWLDSAHSIYKTRDNCWNSSNTSRIYLKTYGSSDTVPVPVINTNNYDCSSEISPTGWNVSYNGNEKFDSVKLTDNYTGEQPSEADILYAQAVSDLSNGLPVQAIIDFKYLTDNYPEYEDLPKILYEFYSCYQMLDTNEGQNYRQPLYQDIVNYLNEKLLSDDFTKNSDFIDNAFDIILMAESIIDLNSAAGGYEFLAFNHPDPDIRLTASWNYNEIQELINSGEGGGQLGIENYELGIEELRELKEFQRMDKLVSDDPVMNKMKRTYEKTSIERKERTDKQISRENKRGEVLNEKIFRSRQVDLQKKNRARRNIFDLRSMNKEEKEKRRMEDIAMTTLDFRNESGSAGRISIPLQYRLEQNYPNPFNPVTNLEFAISKTGFVSLKIYDILGKEIRTLVSEIKQPGIYKIEFDGSSLASGIYFYRMESADFIDTKRMILLK